MRVSITVGETEFRNGYLNIDPISGSDSGDAGGAIKADIRNLDEIIMDSECVEIIAEDVLDYLVRNDAIVTLQHWVTKLRKGGKIIVGGTDSFEVSKQFCQKIIGVDEFNTIMHGGFSQPWDTKLSHTSLEDLQQQLESYGIKIIKKRVNGFRLVIEGERP